MDSSNIPKAEVITDLKELNTIKDNRIFVCGIFDSSIIKNIMTPLLEEVEEQKTLKEGLVKFYIDSNGGYTRYLFDLLAIIEDAKKAGVIVQTNVFSYAYSCGSILACSGTKGHRFISYNAEHLCHLGSVSSGLVINDIELERSADRAKDHFDKIRNLYRKYANIHNLDEAIKNDNYFIRGGAIIDNGLADKFID